MGHIATVLRGEIEASKKVFQKKLTFLKQHDNLEEFLYAHWDYFMLEPNQNRIGILSKAAENSWRTPKSEAEQIAHLHLLINIGYHKKLFGKIHESIIAYEQAFNYYEKNAITSYNILEYCLKPLANNCTRIGDYQRADDLLKKTLQISIHTNNNQQISSTLSNLAASYHSQGKYQQANAVLDQAEKIQSISPKQKSRIHAEIAKNLYELKAYQKAIKEVDYSTQIIESTKLVSPLIKLRNKTTKALCYIKLQQPDKALKEVSHAIDLAKKAYSKHDREIAKLYTILGEVFILKKQYRKGLKSYQNSLTTLLPNYLPKDIYANPERNLFYPENTIKDALDGRAQVFIRLGEFEHALKNYELSFMQEDFLRATYTSQYAKIIQENENRKRSQQVIDLCYQLYLKTGHEHYIQKAFLFAERSKSMVLLDELQNKDLKNNYQNDSLIIREKKLIFQKAEISKEVQLAQFATDFPQSRLESLLSDRNKISNELQVLQTQIHKKYPFTSRSDSLNILTEIQNKLDRENQTLIEYFEGNNQTYIFKISPYKSISWRVIDNKFYQKSLNQLLTFYADDTGSKMANELTHFKELSHQIYQQLLQPELHQNQNKILIIPDALLSFIPFDALITGPTNSSEFEKIPFLVYKNNLSFAYSTRIVLQKKSKSENATKIVGLFPVFDQNNRGLSHLPNTLQEAEALSNYFKTEVYTHQKATSQQFINTLNNAQILHLSTHANTATNSQLASIQFWDKSLYLTELYGYQIPVDLVVLSACETGIGKLQKGEGAMSLARGFSYTGVKNLIVSLWKVNDKSTSILMSNFYKNLADEIPFENALHQAKLSYLSDKKIKNTKKSPYYWAGFIPIKNNSSPFVIGSDHETNGIKYLLLLFITLIMGAFMYKKHIKK